MKTKTFLLTTAVHFSTQVHAQLNEIEVSDGTTSTCYGTAGATACPSAFTTPTIDSFVTDGAGNSSEITTKTIGTLIKTVDAATGNSSEVLVEGEKVGLSTKNAAGEINTIEVNSVRTLVGFVPAGTLTVQNGLMADNTGVYLLGNATANNNLTVLGSTTTAGIDNQSAGITNAGLVSGVTAGALNGTSTEAVNGSQLFTTNTNVTTAQTTANTAVTNAATAQATADAAQTTANTAATTATAAQTTATAAQTTAAAADTKATTAQTTATTALTTANGIASTANTALTTANTALATATSFDSRITNVENTVKTFSADIKDAKNTAERGTAIATAMASIPDVDYGKKMAVGVGVGTYGGKTAFAIGVSGRASENVRLRLNIGTSDKGKVAFGAGGTYSW